MPVLLQSKYDNPQSPSSIPATPVRSSVGRLTSATTSYSPTVTNGSQAQKLNVVTRVAIEGKTKKDPGGASVRMYLKISVPLDSPHVSPGATIPLFPEENVKVLSSQVHPLDQNGAPYSFAASSSPLLYSAARALNMPARSQETFESAFRLPKTNSHSSVLHTSKPETLDGTPPVDIQYTGQILVSGYSVAFVLPKVFLPSRRHREGSHSDFEDDPLPLQTPPSRRRPSIGERNQAQFMAAIDMWIPFITKPTRSPYLLAIPTPRCLHNQIKLRIFPPANTSASMASLSSVEDDGNAWDLTSDPHVTRSASARPSRANSYSHFADDESSDSSTTGTSDACVVQGTFPSAERIRIRWAKPHKLLNHPGVEQDGRRRVGVDDVSGEVICNIRGKGTSASNPEVEGVLMHVEYKGQCKGVWFPGVATLLGLDVSLEAKNSEISWPQGHPSQWEISGSAGYTGFDTGSPRGLTGAPSRTPSAGDGHLLSSSDEGQPQNPNASLLSTSSLLRAPLPSQNLPDYSFEAGNASASLSPAGTLSSLSSSLPTSSTPNLPSDPQCNTPGSPITLHLNMNELPMSAKPIFTFSIAGTILVTARSSQTRPNVSLTSANQKYGEPDPVVLPRFTVLAAHTESTSLVVRNEFDGGSVEVFRPTGDIFNDPQTRKTVLHRNGSTKCGEEGARIALKYFDTLGINGYPSTPRSRTPSTNGAASPMARPILPARGKREGPPMISSLSASVTFLKGEKYSFPTEYAVRVVLSSPAQADPEWLEFGFACLDNLGSSSSSKCGSPSRVRVICASLDGVPVKAELSSVPKSHKDQAAAPFERLSSKEWLHWGKVFTGTSVGGTVIIDYIVKTSLADSSAKYLLKGSAIDLQVLFPTFFMGVSRFEVILDPIPGFHSVPSQSNFHYYHGDNDSSRLLQYSLDPSEKSILTVKVSKTGAPRSPLLTLLKAAFVLTWISLVVAVVWMHQNNSRPLEEVAPVSISETWPESPTITITTTVHATTTTIKWRDDAPESMTPSISTSTNNSPSASSVLYTAPTSASTLAPTEVAISVRPPLPFFDGFSLSSLSQAFNFSLSEKHVEAMKTAMAQAVHTLEIVWHLFRKVYHYPLDPP